MRAKWRGDDGLGGSGGKDLSGVDTWLLFQAYRRRPDQDLRNELVRRHMGLAGSLARRFSHRGECHDDLVQVASLALIKAVERFDPDRGVDFAQFAVPTVVGEIKRHFRDRGWAVRVPRRVQELHLRLAPTVAALTQELGRSPSLDEIASAAGAEPDDVLEALEAKGFYRLAGLEISGDGDGSPSVLARRGTDEPGLERVEMRQMITPLLTEFPERERRILYLRFFESRTQSEIAQELAISQMHVSRILTRILGQLRLAMSDHPALDPLSPLSDSLAHS